MTTRRLLRLLAVLALLGLIAAACSGDDSTDTTGDDTTPDADAAGDDTTPADDGTDDDETEPAATDDEAEPAATDEEAPAFGVRNVPADYPTIQEAVDAADPGDLVLIGEGVYHEAVVVQTDDLVLRGVDRNTVILDGENAEGFENGVIVSANGVAIENLTVRNYTRNGLFWTGSYADDFFVDGYRASYVTAHNIGVYGIYAFNAINGQFDHTYAGGSDDSSFYVGQCDPCNALLYEVEAENSQLGYSGTNSTGTIVANSWFHDNMIGVVPNSLDSEELAPNRDTLVIGNLIENNNNTAVPSRNSGFQVGLGSGVILAGTTGNIVERNTIVGNERAGVIVLDWIAALLGGETDYLAMDNIVRDNVIEGSTLEADLMLALLDVSGGGQGNCFSGNTYGTSTPADAETVLPCGGEDTAELTGLAELLDKFSAGFEPIDYTEVPWPDYDFENMPGDPAADPPAPAVDMPMEIDLDAIVAPDPS